MFLMSEVPLQQSTALVLDAASDPLHARRGVGGADAEILAMVLGWSMSMDIFSVSSFSLRRADQ